MFGSVWLYSVIVPQVEVLDSELTLRGKNVSISNPSSQTSFLLRYLARGAGGQGLQ